MSNDIDNMGTEFLGYWYAFNNVTIYYNQADSSLNIERKNDDDNNNNEKNINNSNDK